MPASETSAADRPPRTTSRIFSPFHFSLCSKYDVVGVEMSWAWSRCFVRRVSSQAISATSLRMRTARSVMSSRFPSGVATT